MYLREFTVAAHGIQEKISPKSIRSKFDNQTRCVLSFYERLFPKFKTKETWKLLINCVEKIKDDRVLTIGGVTEVQIEYNVHDFFQLNDESKKKRRWSCSKKG